MKTKMLTAVIAGMALVLTLSACGGGGGSSQPAQTQQAAPTPVCYVANPNAGKPCIVDDAAVTAGIVNQGDTYRLKQLFARASQGGHYTIGFIGGSITRGEKVISMPNTTLDQTWTWMVYRWFQAKFPKATFSYVNTAVSGTDCEYGNDHLQTMLDARPDFLITEWAVNDSLINQNQVYESYGAVIDRVEALQNAPAVLMLITVDANGNNWDYKDIPVGMSRNVPIISEKTAIMPEQNAGVLSGADRTEDGLHPNILGAQILGALVKGYLNRQLPS